MKYVILKDDSYEIKDESEKEIEDKLNAGTLHISQIINPSIRIQEVAVNKQPSNIRFILNPDKSLLLKTIKAYPYAITMLDNLDERILLNAVRLNPMVIEFIKERNTNHKIRRAALKANPACAQFLSDFTDEEILIILDNMPEALRYVFTEPNDWIYKAIKKKPSTIVIFEKAGIVGRPTKDNEINTDYWKNALERDPYLAYYLTEDEQLRMIDSIVIGITSNKYFVALSQLHPIARKLATKEIKERCDTE